MLAAICLTLSVQAQELCVTVEPGDSIGLIRELNGTNNGPSASKGWKAKGATNRSAKWFKAAEIPYMRPHDAALNVSYGGHHTVDITGIFPDFSKKVNDPASYDFHYTDEYIGTSIACGAKILFRLGQSIEHGSRKYGAIPPENYKKWAQICEHIIRHYNEGWADGYRWDIRYWEIWNEPDLDYKSDRWKTDPRCWGGSYEDFLNFYCTASCHLKKCFPDFKIGGPAVSGDTEWVTRFIRDVAKAGAPLDFFSWHRYRKNTDKIIQKAHFYESLLKENGFENTESIVDEWNYQISFAETSSESAKNRESEIGAACVAATMIRCQNETDISKMMFYDYRNNCSYHVTDFLTGNPTRSYFPLYIWAKLRNFGTQVRAEVQGDNLYATAARNGKGEVLLFICRYSEDLNDVYSKKVYVSLNGRSLSQTTALMTDSYFLNSEVPVFEEEGKLIIDMEPRSFIIIKL